LEGSGQGLVEVTWRHLVGGVAENEIYSIYYEKEGASSSLSDADCYITTGKLLNHIRNILQVYISTREIQTYLPMTFLTNVSYKSMTLLILRVERFQFSWDSKFPVRDSS
jgi:hypothetical protein